MSLQHPIHPIVEECKRLRKSLHPINTRYHGLLDSSSDSNNTLFPFVLLLGNHSSGKSSFINHLLQRKVQTTGVAPTDDNFTIIGPGNEDVDRNGPALVGDPDLGFGGLKTFGPVLVNHTQLKIRSSTAIKDFMIVDSPGMIDSPVPSIHAATNSSSSNNNNNSRRARVGIDRGFDFEGVCRWYAERADVILLFFDPDKPGTTGETLSILTTSLVGLDHKMYIILNKADQFKKIHDFARAYGSLCWNISKVIPRKDLPRIHTMCIPIASADTTTSAIISSITNSNSSNSNGSSNMHDAIERAAMAAALEHQQQRQPQKERNYNGALSSNNSKNKNNSSSSAEKFSKPSFFDHGIHDLEESRAEVIRETLNAPRRRVDNEISRLTEAVSSLLMHCQIVDKAVAMYQDKVWRARYLLLLSALCSVAATAGVSYLCDAIVAACDGSGSSSSGSKAHEGAGSNEVSIFKIFRSSSNGSSGGGSSSSSSTSSTSSSAATAVATATAGGGSAKAAVRSVGAFLQSLFNLQSKESVVFLTALSGTAVTSSVSAWEYFSLSRLLSSFAKKESFEAIYKQLYHKSIKNQDEFTMGMGRLVIQELPGNVDLQFIATASRVEEADFHALERILNDDIANLRRQVSPSYPLLTAPATTSTTAATAAGATAAWYEAARSSLPAQPRALTGLQSVQKWAAALLGDSATASTINATQSQQQLQYCTPERLSSPATTVATVAAVSSSNGTASALPLAVHNGHRSHSNSFNSSPAADIDLADDSSSRYYSASRGNSSSNSSKLGDSRGQSKSGNSWQFEGEYPSYSSSAPSALSSASASATSSRHSSARSSGRFDAANGTNAAVAGSDYNADIDTSTSTSAGQEDDLGSVNSRSTISGMSSVEAFFSSVTRP